MNRGTAKNVNTSQNNSNKWMKTVSTQTLNAYRLQKNFTRL